MTVGANTKEYWNKKHMYQDLYIPYDFNDIEKSPNSYHGVASNILLINKESIDNKSLLEIGCAGGYFCAHIKQNILPDFEITGWDFSHTGIDAAVINSNKLKLDINYEERDFLLNPVDKDFGVICMFETIEHIESPNNFKVVDNMLEHSSLTMISTVTTKDDCGGEHLSHYEFDTFDKMGYDVLWKAKLLKIDMSATGDMGDYYYVFFLLKGKLY